jgi:RNase H-fold protein (predicted Holliday junction resolvase)
VVGIPTNFAGKDTKVTGSIQNFIKLINSTLPNITVHTINERSTTLDAKKLLGKNPTKHDINHQSAVGILELYFQKVG